MLKVSHYDMVKDMITDEDVKKLAKKFATKMDLAKVEFDLKSEIEEVKDKIDGIVTKDEHRKLMTMVENTFTEVKKMREEQSAHFGEHRLINDRLYDIEGLPVIAHELKMKKN